MSENTIPNPAFENIVVLLNELDNDEQLELVSLISERLRDTLNEEPEEAEPLLAKKPRLLEMFTAGFVEAGTRLYVRDENGHPVTDKSAVLVSGSEVRYKNQIIPINSWAKRVLEWQSVNIYTYVISELSERTLGEIREEYMTWRQSQRKN